MATKATNTENARDILIAEDSRIQAELLRRRLVDAGYLARVAVNGAEALRQARERKPDLIVSDIEMPEMDGYSLCKAVKEDPLLRDIPFILLSSLSEPEDIIQGLHVGADNYVTKPYESGYLISRIGALLETPVVDEKEVPDDEGLKVTLAGKQYVVKPGRHQTLNLLVSTFENAVEKNRELIRVNEELTVVQDRLEQQNRQLQVLNEEMAAANDRMSHELEAGAAVQQRLLPTTLPDVPGINLAWSFRPCDELAGDFLNVIQLDDRHIGIYVVDVSGHGVAASLLSVTISRVLVPLASVASVVLQEIAGSSEDRIVPPDEVLSELNRRFPMELSADQYFTIVYGILDRQTNEFRYASAAQPAIVRIDSGGKADCLAAEGFPVGWVPDASYQLHTVRLQPGDRLWLYSDGVPEAMNETEAQFGDQHMLEAFVQGHSLSLEDAVTQIVDDVESWCNPSEPEDDVSVLALEVAQ